jgi:hypothetical protein
MDEMGLLQDVYQHQKGLPFEIKLTLINFLLQNKLAEVQLNGSGRGVKCGKVNPYICRQLAIGCYCARCIVCWLCPACRLVLVLATDSWQMHCLGKASYSSGGSAYCRKLCACNHHGKGI